MTEPTPTEPQAPAAAKPAEPATPTATAAPVAEAPKPGDLAAGFKSEESKNAVLADLAKERDARQALEAKIEAQNKAMLAAFGVAEVPETEDAAAMVATLREEIANDRRAALIDRLAAANGIEDPLDVALLTETDPEKLKAQAERVGALVKAKTAEVETPAFQPNPGQGRGGTASLKEDDSYPSHWIPKKKQ